MVQTPQQPLIRLPASPGGRMAAVALCIIAIGVVVQVVLAVQRAFDPGEFVAMHGAWLIAQGQVPYRDYFDHHAPLFHGVLSLFAWGMQPERSFAAAQAMLTASRLWMLTWYGLSLALIWRIAARWRGPQVAWVATALLVGHVTFGEKVLEVRPESMFVPLWLGALWALLSAIEAPARRRPWAWAGLALGLALATSGKLLMAAPALLVGIAYGLWRTHHRAAISTAPKGIGIAVAVAMIPLVAVAAWFAAHGELAATWQHLRLIAGEWRHHSPRFGFVGWVVARNLLFTGLAITGLLGARRPATNSLDGVLAIWTVGTLIGLWLMPVVQRQHYVLVLPLLALFAAEALLRILDRQAPWTAWNRSALQIGAAVTVGLAMFYGLDPFPVVPGLPDVETYRLPSLLWQCLTIGLAVFLAWWRPAWASVCVALVALNPLPTAWAARLNTADGQLEGMGRVMAMTGPTDTVMDGSTGWGTFRPHALRHFNLSPENSAWLEPADKRGVVAAIESGQLAPKAVVLDLDLQVFAEDLKPLLRRWYRPIDAVDRMVLLRRRQPLPLAAIGGVAPGGQAAVAPRHLDQLWRRPGTAEAMVAVPSLLIGHGFPVDVDWTPGDPAVIAGIWRDHRSWHLQTWLHGGFYAPRAEGAVAWRKDGHWRVASSTGRQDSAGNWDFQVDLPDGEPLPSVLYVRPKGWNDWFVVGTPVQQDRDSTATVPASPDWTVWPRTAVAMAPQAVTLPAALPKDGILAVTAWPPLDASLLPVDLPGARATTPADAVNPFRRPESKLAYGLEGIVVYLRATPGMILSPSPTWTPEVFRLRTPG
jgi:hypothetical protein